MLKWDGEVYQAHARVDAGSCGRYVVHFLDPLQTCKAQLGKSFQALGYMMGVANMVTRPLTITVPFVVSWETLA